jgi:nucleoside 2-deoxyribosyltransferase
MSAAQTVPFEEQGGEILGDRVPYTIYAAGGLFTQHEIATNVFLKEAVARCSNGKFQLVLPQSKEMRDLDGPDAAATIRNVDLVEVVRADFLLARFDGLELDAGTVVEFMMAKALGKPALILRCDHRGLDSDTFDAPYNLMARNWPRTIEVHTPSLLSYCNAFSAVRGGDGSFQAVLDAELDSVQRGLDELAAKITAGLDALLGMASPYPPAYQEMMYQALRFCPGSGFDTMLSAAAMSAIVERLRQHGTL